MPPSRTQHRCFWPGCRLVVPKSKLGCAPHWYRLPQDLRTAILAEYRPGQTLVSCSQGYLAALEDVMEYAASHARTS